MAPADALAGIGAGELSVQVDTQTRGQPVSLVEVAQASRDSHAVPLQIETHHAGGRLRLRMRVAVPPGVAAAAPSGRLWVTGLRVQSH
jgi:hypothetical protein